MKLINLIATRKILSEHAGDKIPAVTAYKIMKFFKASDTEEAFYNEKMKELIDEYAEKDEAGKPIVKVNGIQISRDRIEDCNKAIKELQETDVEKPKLVLNLKELELFQLSVEEISTLDEFIIEE